MNWKRFNNPVTLIILVLLLIVFEVAFLFKGNIVYNNQDDRNNLEQYAETILGLCKDANYRPGCYDKEIPKLMDFISMGDAFGVTRIVQARDRIYTYCHVLGHELSAREIQKDPDDWKDVVIKCPSGVCSNGCLHGGLQERFRAETYTDAQIEEIKPDLHGLCEARSTWSPTGLEQASCYHAMGHLTMYLTGADINKSIDICDEVTMKSDGRDYRRLCYDGAFMQIFQPLEPEDFDLVEGKEVKKDELYAYCSQFTNAQRASCWTEGWPLYRVELQQPKGLTEYCSKTEEIEQGRCYDALVFVITAQFGLDEKRMETYCSGLPDQWLGRCFGNAAARMIETDYINIQKAVGLCKTAEGVDPNNTCFKELLKYSDFNFHRGSKEFYDLCNNLPNSWKDKCLNEG